MKVLLLLILPLFAISQTKTTVVLLGTGMPRPSMTASGPATAVVVEGQGGGGAGGQGRSGSHVFLVDAGSGVERQLSGANLPIDGVDAVFITHLHSDHTLGYPDLIFTSWVMGRKAPLQVYGPHGLQRMTDHLIEAYSEDIEVRTEGLAHQTADGWRVDVHEVAARGRGARGQGGRELGGVVVYDSLGIRVTAFAVPHGMWKESYAYRFDTPDRSIVISGDTRYSEELAQFSKSVDVLVHEVYSAKHLKPENRPGGEDWPEYMHTSHTSDVEIGHLALKARPKLVVLTHIIRMGATDEELLEGVRKGGFMGNVVVGKDLGKY